MAGGCWRIASGLLVLVPVVVAGLAGCGNGATSTTKASSTGTTAATLRKALLTRVNGVAAAAPASSGTYASMSAAGRGKQAASAVQVTPKTCTGAATVGFDPAALAGAPAAAVTFRVGTNGVSEVLIASSAKSASTALAGHVPAECAQYQEKVGGKTYTYGVTEKAITGIGKQARVLNVHAEGAQSGDMWSLIYRTADFVGTVTVVGPNATEAAVTELGQQAYAFAAKSLS
ncbi:MAG: hypothetical protein QOG28_625 [Trebonia sp.]|jgi:hypothetical protein|nr:hypothetical protein [Trebonia sp.]